MQLDPSVVGLRGALGAELEVGGAEVAEADVPKEGAVARVGDEGPIARRLHL